MFLKGNSLKVKMDKNKSHWWAVYRNLSNSPQDLIAFVKGTEREMQRINLGLYYGNAKIKSEKPKELNYKTKFREKIIIHSMEEKDAIRISNKLLHGREKKIEENPFKVWFEITKDSKNIHKNKIPDAYFRKGNDAENYLSLLRNGTIITLTKNPSKKLEFKVLNSENFPVAIFKDKEVAKNYQINFLNGLGKVEKR